MVVHLLILVGVGVVAFVWRRERFLLRAPLHPSQRTARLGRRFAALIIDLGILSPIWAFPVLRLWTEAAPELTLRERMAMGSTMANAGLYWVPALIATVLAMYGTLCEGLSGATLGKRIVGLRVVREGGERLTLGAALVRNVARVVEFHSVSLVLLVAITPSRQRLGDLLGRTVVVEFASTLDVEVGSDEAPPTPDN